MNGSLCTIIRDSDGSITAIEVEAGRPGRRDRELKKLNQPAARLYHARTLAARRWASEDLESGRISARAARLSTST
jgi:hypothetical protein